MRHLLCLISLFMLLAPSAATGSPLALTCGQPAPVVVTTELACCCATYCGCEMEQAPERPEAPPATTPMPRIELARVEVAPPMPAAPRAPPLVFGRVAPSISLGRTASETAALLCVWTR